jgi:glycosyltransferase involved in cell wall biosynthesis
MRIVALLAVRNEALYIGRCLEHLYQQGIETCVIDNESTDATLAIAEKFLGRGVFRIEKQEYPGFFDLAGQLNLKQSLAGEIAADWLIHHDADEIREAPAPYRSLRHGIESAENEGYNAVNFDEFVFLPTTDHESFEKMDYVAMMNYYYFFEPWRKRRINAWKNAGRKIDLIASGGHGVNFEGRKIFPVNFVLRHYIALSREHLIRKYASERVYSEAEIKERGWHAQRASFAPDRFRLPGRDRLKRVQKGDWDKSEPWKRHPFFERPPA